MTLLPTYKRWHSVQCIVPYLERIPQASAVTCMWKIHMECFGEEYVSALYVLSAFVNTQRHVTQMLVNAVSVFLWQWW